MLQECGQQEEGEALLQVLARCPVALRLSCLVTFVPGDTRAGVNHDTVYTLLTSSNNVSTQY